MHSDADPNSSDYEEVKDSDLPPDESDSNHLNLNNKQLISSSDKYSQDQDQQQHLQKYSFDEDQQPP